MIIILFQITFIIFGVEAIENDSLIHVHAIFRHGDRAPLKLYSSNVNKIKLWPNGLGELTNLGIGQQFQLGQWLRRRYNGFISEKYNYSEIYVRSTDIDRTLMSAESNLAGLYFNQTHYVIPNLKWIPIPIHTIPQKSDIIMLQDDCDKYLRKKAEMYKRFLPVLKKYQSTLDLIRNYTNEPQLEFSDLWEVYDYLICEKYHNITWDKWVTKEIYYNMTQMYKMDWKIMYYGDELPRLAGGLFLHEIIKQLMNTTFTPPPKRREKFRVYSGHDTDIAALMSAIGVYEERQPPYATCFLIELWKKADSKDNLENVYIKMYLRNNTGQKSTYLPEIILKQCPQYPCSLLKFIEVVRERTMTKEQYKAECFSVFLPTFIVGIFTAFTLILIIYICCRRRGEISNINKK